MQSKSSKATIVVALIGLAGVLGAALINSWDNLFPDGDPDAVSLPGTLAADTTPVEPTAWQLVGRDDFSTATGWYAGDRSSDWPNRWELVQTAGRYRWHLDLAEQWAQRLQESPFGPETEFRASVDVAIASSTGGRGAAGLLFGRVGQEDFTFWLDRTGRFQVIAGGQGNTWETLIGWSAAPSATTGPNRLGVAVRGQRATFRVNGEPVGSVSLEAYRGGKVGVVAGGTDQATFVVEFDNFVLERPGS